MPFSLVRWVSVLALCYALVSGLVILISPSRYRNWRDKFGRLDRMSTRNPDWKPGLELAPRSFGAVLVVFSLYLLTIIIRAILFHTHTSVQPHPGKPSAPPMHNWYSYVMETALTLAGVYALVKPEVVIRWARSTRPDRTFDDESIRKSLWAMRIGGAILVLAALSALVPQLKRVW